MEIPFAYRALLPDEWETYKDVRLAALADSPDAFGSTLAAEQLRLPEGWRDRLAVAQVSGADLPLAAFLGQQVVGLVWAKVDAVDSTTVHVFQMWVAPQHRGQGIGKALLDHVISWARSIHAQALQLGVACGDTPAVRLYSAAGFAVFGAREPLRDGSPLLAQSMRLEFRSAV